MVLRLAERLRLLEPSEEPPPPHPTRARPSIPDATSRKKECRISEVYPNWVQCICQCFSVPEPREGRARKLERDEYKRLRALLADRMTELGMSQRELGKLLGMSSSYVNKLILGKRTLELTEFLDLCRALQLEPTQVLKDCASSEG